MSAEEETMINWATYVNSLASLAVTEQKDDELVVSIPLPGLTQDDVDIVCSNGVLSVAVKEAAANRRFVQYSRGIFRLSDKWDMTTIKAHMENGVLTLSVPAAAGKRSLITWK